MKRFLKLFFLKIDENRGRQAYAIHHVQVFTITRKLKLSGENGLESSK